MSTAPRVLVAHENEILRSAALRVLAEAGFVGVSASDGAGVRASLHGGDPPAALVLDVGLPGLMAFEACEEVRRRGLATRVVLIASVYSHTSYKRRPTSLYGADDYVEQHHIPDMLVPKLQRLLGASAPRGASAPASERPATSSLDDEAALRIAGEARLSLAPGAAATSGADAGDLDAQARKMAWAILADIVLYNGDQVEQGLADGTLEQRLARDLDEGRAMLAARVPASFTGSRDLLGEALKEYVAWRRAGGDRSSWPAGTLPWASGKGR